MFSKKATKIDEIFTVDLTLYNKCQINGEDFVNFCRLPRTLKASLFLYQVIFIKVRKNVQIFDRETKTNQFKFITC